MTQITEWAGVVSKQHGAYLISIHDPSGDRTPDELFDAASNVRVAKQVAKEIAESIGFVGPWRWEERLGGWWLHATDFEHEPTGD